VSGLTIAEQIRAAISEAYYDARNDGMTMEDAADAATAKVVAIITEDEPIDDENLRTWKEERPSSPFLNVGEGEYGMGTEPTP
jgi:hypothetical protein